MPLRQKLCLPTSHSSSTNSRVFQAEPIRALLYRLAPAPPRGPSRTRQIAYPADPVRRKRNPQPPRS